MKPHQNSGPYYSNQGRMVYTPAAPVDMSATTYLTVEWRMSFYGTTDRVRMSARADGAELTAVATRAAGSNIVTTFVCPDASVAVFEFEPTGNMVSHNPEGVGASTSSTLSLFQVERTNVAPVSGTARQSGRSVAVLGSARTPGSLELSHATSALGDVIVYTGPLGGGYNPALRTQLTSTAGTTDTGTVSGAYSNTPTVTYSVPAASLPTGGYVLMARVKYGSSADVALPWTAQTKIGANTFGPQLSGTRTHALTTSYRLVTLGGVTLPPTAVQSSSAGVVELTVTAGATTIDEVWLFYVGDGAALTVVSAGTATPAAGGSSSRMWIDSPSLSYPRPAVWVGTLADRSDARHAGPDATSWGLHDFTPGDMRLFVVTSNALSADVSLSYFPRWFTHAGR